MSTTLICNPRIDPDAKLRDDEMVCRGPRFDPNVVQLTDFDDPSPDHLGDVGTYSNDAN